MLLAIDNAKVDCFVPDGLRIVQAFRDLVQDAFGNFADLAALSLALLRFEQIRILVRYVKTDLIHLDDQFQGADPFS